MSSVEEIEFADIQNMEYPLTRNENKNICNSYSYEPYSLTVVFGAVCLDGIVLIADRKLTNTIGGKDDAGIKIHGDLEHILMGYTGAVKMFDIFRKYVVGDVIITRADEERYKYDNVLDTMSTLLKEFNDSIGRQHSMFEMLVARHRGVNSELYHIDISGKTNKINYKAIGIGKLIADTFCKKLFEDNHKQPTMKEFIKRAYTAIMYMEQFCSGMGVGI
jgi:20S proteasome alpha/beta subunit